MEGVDGIESIHIPRCYFLLHVSFHRVCLGTTPLSATLLLVGMGRGLGGEPSRASVSSIAILHGASAFLLSSSLDPSPDSVLEYPTAHWTCPLGCLMGVLEMA